MGREKSPYILSSLPLFFICQCVRNPLWWLRSSIGMCQETVNSVSFSSTLLEGKEDMNTNPIAVATSAEVPILQAPILELEAAPDDSHEMLSEALHRIQSGPHEHDLEWVVKVFHFIHQFTERYGPNTLLRNTVCARFNLDSRTFDLYSQNPELVERLERARLALFSRPLHSNPDPATMWPHVLKVFMVIYRVGTIRHSRLLLWVARRTPTWWVHKAVAFLTEGGLIETYQVAGGNPRHQSRWYRFVAGPDDAATDTV